jgi:hypothetical protein
MQRWLGNEWLTLAAVMALSAIVPFVWRRFRGSATTAT